MGAPADLCREVRELILFTRHDRTPPTQDGKLIVDIDLASLGAPENIFDANGEAIREEYAHVPEPDFNRGRANMLGRFLQRPRIYYTDAYFIRFERQARENLKRSLAAIGA